MIITYDRQNMFIIQATGGQSSKLHLNAVHIFNASINQASVEAQDSCFYAYVSNMHSSKQQKMFFRYVSYKTTHMLHQIQDVFKNTRQVKLEKDENLNF